MNKNDTNNHFEQYKRIIKCASSTVIIMLELAIYWYVWLNYYNRNMQQPFYRRGNWLIAGDYVVVLLLLHRLYGGLKIGIYKYWNLVYSHMISIIGVNIFSYVQVVLFDKKMHNPTALMVMTVVDFILVMVWAWAYKKVYNTLFPKRKLLLVYGQNSMFHLMNRIDTREDKYEIAKMISIDKGIDLIIEQAEKYDGIIIGDIPADMRNKLVKMCFCRDIRSYTLPKLSDILLRSSTELNIFDSPLYLSRNIGGLAWDQKLVKRMVDIIVASLLLVISSPFFLLIAILIRCTDPGPVLYTQKRLTEGGTIFNIYKFRTMVVDAEKKSGPIKAGDKDSRILPIGHILRATRLDELPQLINILKGEMSMVGPRPERPELTEIITRHIPEFEYRLKVKAGLTGYAQIYGRYCNIGFNLYTKLFCMVRFKIDSYDSKSTVYERVNRWI